jgi:hypothetical protein
MAQNTNPIFTLVPDVAWGAADGNGGTAGPLKTQNTAYDGTGTVLTVFTAGTNGSYLQRLIARPVGTNIASVLRVFLNNGSTNATVANNAMISELTLPATTISAVAALQSAELNLNFAIPTGFKVNVVLGTTVAAGYVVSCIGGDY